MPEIDPTFVLLNRIEAGFWIVIGIVIALVGIHKARRRGFGVIAAATFFVFGLSDLVETRTGAWWRPWWLFAWKTVCVLNFLLLFVWIRRRVNPRKASCEASNTSNRSPAA